jgi:Trk-type K+ transport system membrane component
MGPICTAIVLGGLGFPVMMELGRRALAGRLRLRPRRRLTVAEVNTRAQQLVGPRRYSQLGSAIDRQGFRGPVLLSLHTRLMLIGTLTLLFVGTFGFALFEWNNANTLAGESFLGHLGQAFFSGGVTPRTAGFNTVDYAQVRPETRFLTDLLMLVGGGSASTAGGVKVTTIMVLILAAATEVRGFRDVNAMDRRIPDKTVRIALSVMIVSALAVVIGTMAMMAMTNLGLDRSLFESISALATVGLSADVTPFLPEPAQLLLVLLMFLGRVGPITLVSALALRLAERRYRLPEGRPLIG